MSNLYNEVNLNYTIEEPQIGPKKPGPRPSDCPWCNTPNCNHCRCPGYPKCDHAPNTLCPRPRYKRRLVCNPCEKHKLTKSTKKNRKPIVENIIEETLSPALSPRDKLSEDFSTKIRVEPATAPFVPDPSVKDIIYIKEVNSNFPSAIISISIFTAHLSEVREYIETKLWNIFNNYEFKFYDTTSHEIKRDQEKFILAWDNCVEKSYPHQTTQSLIPVKVLQIVYIDPSKSRKRVKKEYINIISNIETSITMPKLEKIKKETNKTHIKTIPLSYTGELIRSPADSNFSYGQRPLGSSTDFTQFINIGHIPINEDHWR